jgi:hypothetical protein
MPAESRCGGKPHGPRKLHCASGRPYGAVPSDPQGVERGTSYRLEKCEWCEACDAWDLCAAASPSEPASTVKLNGSCPLEETPADPERSASSAGASGTMEVLVSVTSASFLHL